MAKFPTPELIQAIIDAITESGGAGSLISPPPQPRRFSVQYVSSTFELWVYIWTLTHGGGAARPKNEYRVQLTGVTSPLAYNPTGGPTVLIGYEPNLQCFAGFDLSKHKRFSPNSPSIQIPITTLHKALQDGLSFAIKGNNEIAIGFRPDQLIVYALNADLLHAQGGDAKAVNLLERAAALELIEPAELAQVKQERQRVINTVSRLARASNFRAKVMTAYDRRCAVTRMQLKLVDAAHIMPVGARGSNDEIYNGICLSPTYHRAFDCALIYLDDSLVMRINPSKERELVRLGISGGLDDFKMFLNQRIHLPAEKKQWPNAEMIERANKIRGIEI